MYKELRQRIVLGSEDDVFQTLFDLETAYMYGEISHEQYCELVRLANIRLDPNQYRIG